MIPDQSNSREDSPKEDRLFIIVFHFSNIIINFWLFGNFTVHPDHAPFPFLPDPLSYPVTFVQKIKKKMYQVQFVLPISIWSISISIGVWSNSHWLAPFSHNCKKLTKVPENYICLFKENGSVNELPCTEFYLLKFHSLIYHIKFWVARPEHLEIILLIL